MLPKILEALDDPAWRTKQAAIQLLGAMAYCAPKQLGNCLPQIVPRLTGAFSDTHPKVIKRSGERERRRERERELGVCVAGLYFRFAAFFRFPESRTVEQVARL